MEMGLKVLGLLVFLIFVAPIGAQEKPRLFVGAASKTLGYSPLWVGAKKGFFEQQGLDVQVVLLRGMPMTVQALSSGSLHIGTGGPEAYMGATDRGLDFVITGGVINAMTQFIVAQKQFKSIEDLRGRTVGSSSLTGGTVTAFREAMRQKGLEYPRDYNILVIAGGSSGNLAALQTGQIAATTVAVPLNFAAEELGFHSLGRLAEAVPFFVSNGIAVRRSWAEKNRTDFVRFMKGVVLSLRWLYDNKEAAVDFLSKEMKLKPAHALKGWEYYTRYRVWPIDGENNIEGLKNNLRTYQVQTGSKATSSDVSKYVEESYLNEALKDLGRRQ